MNQPFIHLDIHTEYSIIDGICRIDDLLETAAEQKMPAVAVTDRNNLFGVVKFYRAALKAGVKPLIAAEMWVVDGEHPLSRILVFCRNNAGYRQLTQLLTYAYQHQASHQPVIERKRLRQNTDGLLIIAGGLQSDIGQALAAGKSDKAQTLAAEWAHDFPQRFYLMISRIGREHEETYIKQVLALAEKQNLPVVASNEVRFIQADDYAAHEARVAIHAGFTLQDPNRPREYTAQQYLRSPAEMHELFADLPEVLQNTLEFAKRCNAELELDINHLPQFPLPKGETSENYLSIQADIGMQKRFGENISAVYAERLQIELKVINAMGFASYFLIVADFIQWSKDNDIPVGPGRGSGAGSLVAYVLGITDLDPLQYDLLFERFLNPERISLPDFDIDFCMERRDEVIEYVAKRYGRDRVAQIITFGTMAAKAVVRDVGRVLAYPYGFVDKIAKLIPFELGITLEKALIDSDILRTRYEQEDEVKELIDLALKLEGITRNAGKHAGGVVIAPSPLTDFVPLYCEEDGSGSITQFDKDDVESVGLVKFDFLGLRTLTIIQWACATINVDITKIPLDDKETFKLLQRCQTTAVFQLESRGMKELIKRQQPDCFEDIIALVALFRPGPLQSGMVDDFINRKHGRAVVTYLHPSLEPILRPTYGVILYQEQVMQIAQVLAGYTLGAADLLRRAMGKKKPEEMAKQREIFVKGSVERGVSEQLASNIFDLMEKFAGYGFNKSHSAAYALIAYQTAWLKTHYTAAFMAAVLSADMDNTDKVVIFIEDCQTLGVKVFPPNVNRGDYKFIVDNNDIIFGLGALKGVGEAAIESIVNARKSGGDFKNLFDLCQRVDSRKVNRRVLEALIKSGAMDVLHEERAELFASIDTALKLAEKHTQNKMIGQVDLFADTSETEVMHQYITTLPWSPAEKLEGEKATLGFYCSGHPLDAVSYELRQLLPRTLKQLRPEPKRNQWMAGLIIQVRTVKTKQNKQMQIVTLDDKTARMDVVLFPDDVDAYRDLLVKDTLVFVEGEVAHDDYSGGLRARAKRLMNLSQARAQCVKSIRICVHADHLSPQFNEQLMGWLQPHVAGPCPIDIEYQQNNATATLRLGPAWWVHPTDALVSMLIEKFSASSVRIDYRALV